MSQEPSSPLPPPSPTPAPAPLTAASTPSPQPAPVAKVAEKAPEKPVKMPAPKTVKAPAVLRTDRRRGFPWNRLAEVLVFALLAAGAGWYVAKQLFVGEDQVVATPVGPVAALLSPGGTSSNPAVDSSAPAVK